MTGSARQLHRQGRGHQRSFHRDLFQRCGRRHPRVVAGTYAINNLAAGACRTLSLKVKVGSGAVVGSSKSFLVTTTSTGRGTPKDAVKATVKAS